MNNFNRSYQSNQAGAALLVALLLILVSTLLGMTVRRSSIVENMMVSNEEIRQRTFHVAEAAMLDAMVNFEPAVLTTDDVKEIPVDSLDRRVAVSVTARQEGLAPIANTSLKLFANFYYAIESTASNDDVSAARGVVAGVAQRIPLPAN